MVCLGGVNNGAEPWIFGPSGTGEPTGEMGEIGGTTGCISRVQE
jgi:hypothetical protein